MDEVKILLESNYSLLPCPAPSKCSICLAADSRYTCPRCNVRYCSVECYRGAAHTQCSELFYRDCFTQGLREMSTDDGTRRRMMEMLHKVETENEEGGLDVDNEEADSCEVDDLDQLSNINLDADDVTIWKQLPKSEQRRFVEMLEDGRLAQLVETWQPWWLSDPSPPITELGQSSQQPMRSSRIPHVLTGLSGIGRMLSKSRPSQAVRFGVVSALYAYAYAARLYNGDHVTLAGESACVITAILYDADKYAATSDLSLVISGCIEAITRDRNFVSNDFSIAIIDDVIRIISMRTVAEALSDCHMVLKKGKRDSVKDLGDRGGRSRERVYGAAGLDNGQQFSVGQDASGEGQKEAEVCGEGTSSVSTISESDSHRSACFRIRKKLEFFISWTREYGKSLASLVPLLEIELCERTSDLARHQSDKEVINKLLADNRLKTDGKQEKKLIEEIETDL